MDEKIRELRAKEYSRLDASGLVYLDHTGSTLYPESLVREHAERLLTGVDGNPHSRNPASRKSTELAEAARARVLKFFKAHAEGDAAVFTLTASGAVQRVGAAAPLGPATGLRPA